MSNWKGMSFSKWKILLMRELVELRSSYENDEKLTTSLDSLINELRYARVRDLARILFNIHLLLRAYDLPTLKGYIPPAEAIESWLDKEE